MRKFKHLALVAIAALVALGCSEKFDDSQIWDKIDSLEGRIELLEQSCRQMNTNIASLQTMVEALQNNDYVTNITPIYEDGKVVGYTMTFSKSGAITIYHGKDGQTPSVGIKKDTDGIYYWTLDGKWLLDENGAKVKAQGTDGKDGADGEDGKDGANGEDGANGLTPVLKIGEDGYWYVSYDNGSTWTKLGKATGENGTNGDSMFTSITYDEYYVYITLKDGTVLEIPRRNSQTDDAGQFPPNNEIWYTSSDGNIINPHNVNSFGVTIISNTYKNGKGVIVFDGNVTKIGSRAFYESQRLTSIAFPECLISIENPDAFENCDNLTNFKGKIVSTDGRCIIINNELITFAPSQLTSYTIPNGVKVIKAASFGWCEKIENIIIPNSVINVEELAFIGCNSLKTISGKYASDDARCLIIDGKLIQFAVDCGLTEYTIPDNVTSIGWCAFEHCSLTNIHIPNSVTNIDRYSFRWSKITSITIPENVTFIGEQAFHYCSDLANVYCKPTTPPLIISSWNIFAGNASDFKIYVPTESVDKYKSADYWKDNADKIVGYDFN